MKLDHVLLRTTSLENLSQFLIDVIGLEIGYRPPFPFNGIWFYSEGHPLLHAIEDQHEFSAGDGAIAHVALTGGDYPGLIQTLKERGITYREQHVPISGQCQVFVEGPGGLIVEMLFPATTTVDQANPDTGMH